MVLKTLEENYLDGYISILVKEYTSNVGCINFKKNQAKAKQIIYDSLKDDLMSMITSLNTANECFDTLTNLYEKKAPSQKRALKNKLRNLKMEKDEIVAPFFTKIFQVRDQLASIRVVVDKYYPLQTSINRLPSSWESFLAAINGREVEPNFERLWHDYLQEEG